MMRAAAILLFFLPVATAIFESKCCNIDGRGSAHAFGMVIGLALGISLNGWAKVKFPNSYRPGTAAYCRRMLLNELFDLLIVLGMFFAAGDTLREEDEDAFRTFGASNGLVLVFLIVYWSRLNPWKDYDIWVGGREDRGMRSKLTKALAKARTTITGRKLISQSLRLEVEGFNERMKKKYKMAKTMALHVAIFKFTDVVLIAYQYLNLCDGTICSFYTQTGTILLLVTFWISSEDVYRLRKGQPDLINLSNAEGKGKSSMSAAAMDRVEAYSMVRDLIEEIMEVGKIMSVSMAKIVKGETSTQNLIVYDWDCNPEKDPRADVFMWCIIYSLGLSNVINCKLPISVTAIHMAHSALKDTLATLNSLSGLGASDEPRIKSRLLRNVAVLYQASFHSLPDEDREWFVENMASWAAEARNMPDPLQYTLMFLAQILPDEEDAEAAAPVTVDDARDLLVDYFDEQVLETNSGRDILISDDAALEWIYMQWQSVKTHIEGREETPEVEAYIDALLIIQEPALLRQAAVALDEFRQRIGDHATIPIDLLLSGLRSKMESLKRKADEKSGDTQASRAVEDPEHWKRAFEQRAGGREGTLSRSQFRELYLEMGVKPTPHELQKYFADNVLSFDEFEEFVHNNVGGFRKMLPFVRADTIIPCCSTDRIPLDMIRVPAKAADLAPLNVHQLAARLDEDLDIRAFAPEGNTALIVTLVSPLQQVRVHKHHVKGGGKSKSAVDISRRATKQSGGRRLAPSRIFLYLPTWRATKEAILNNTLYVVVGLIYLYAFVNAARHIGKHDDKDMNDTTFFGLPPYYQMDKYDIQRFLIPLVYGNMHMNMVTLGLLPLTMSRWLIRFISNWEWLGALFRIEYAYWWHKRCGYNLAWGILVGATLWWVAMNHTCVERTSSVACSAFYPKGNYFDLFGNDAAVIFLREIVVTTLTAMLVTSGFVFQQSLPWPYAVFKVHYAYEWFYYTHIVGAYAIAALAFSSRFDIFYPVIPLWGIYALDFVWMRTVNTHSTHVAGATCFSASQRAVMLRLKKPKWFSYKAGQTAFIKIPGLSVLEWHPFSIASGPADEHVEFLIDCSHGAKTWTDKLFVKCQERGNMVEMGAMPGSRKGSSATGAQAPLKAYLYGPCGSSFQSFENHQGIMLIGGGSGLPSSLSVLRHIFSCRRGARKIKAKRISFVWSTRQVESLLWCWGHLKACVEQEVGYLPRTKWTEAHEEQLAALGDWLDISINVTQMGNKALKQIVDIEQNSKVGSWLVHRLNAGRITGWEKIFRQFHASVGSDALKVFFCGPGRMVRDIRAAAQKIEGFHVEVSSENFHDN